MSARSIDLPEPKLNQEELTLQHFRKLFEMTGWTFNFGKLYNPMSDCACSQCQGTGIVYLENEDIPMECPGCWTKK